MDNDSDDEVSIEPSLFTEPEGFRPPSPKPTFESIKLINDGPTLNLRLVGKSPLWGHLVWNAGKLCSEYLQQNADRLVRGKSVLEFGAGAALPALTCAIEKASRVVITDYPDPDLIDNIQMNIESTRQHFPDPSNLEILAEGYRWGSLPLPSTMLPENSFDLVILADLVFNHIQHDALITSVKATLSKKKDSAAVVFFTPHRPWLIENDFNFFKLCDNAGLKSIKVLETKVPNPMFEVDKGDPEVRRTVYGFEVKWADA